MYLIILLCSNYFFFFLIMRKHGEHFLHVSLYFLKKYPKDNFPEMMSLYSFWLSIKNVASQTNLNRR